MTDVFAAVQDKIGKPPQKTQQEKWQTLLRQQRTRNGMLPEGLWEEK